MITANYIGAMCREYRETCTPYNQSDVAEEMMISRETVSKFERGIRPNAVVFMWYIKQGIFEWVPIKRWNGWSCYLNGD